MVASAGDDKKISLWGINGTSLGTVPVAGKDGGDTAEVSSLHCFFYFLFFSHFTAFIYIYL